MLKESFCEGDTSVRFAGQQQSDIYVPNRNSTMCAASPITIAHTGGCVWLLRSRSHLGVCCKKRYLCVALVWMSLNIPQKQLLSLERLFSWFKVKHKNAVSPSAPQTFTRNQAACPSHPPQFVTSPLSLLSFLSCLLLSLSGTRASARPCAMSPPSPRPSNGGPTPAR